MKIVNKIFLTSCNKVQSKKCPNLHVVRTYARNGQQVSTMSKFRANRERGCSITKHERLKGYLSVAADERLVEREVLYD